MSKEIYISSTPHETRLAIVENDALTEIYYERENEYTLAGSIYNGKVTRVLPGMQSSFVDIGLERDAFLYITDFMEEAGDSADFDTSGNGDSRRRNGGAPAIEGTLATEQTTDSGNRPERTDRNGRGDRGRGRGRRDRGGNRDRQPSDATAPLDAPEAQETPDAQNFNRDDFSPSAEFSSDSASLARTNEADLGGEGAPGADGNRRWRGTRGRRRGRGLGQRDESSQTAAAPSSETPSVTSYGDDSFDVDGSAESTSPTAPGNAEPSTQATSHIPENFNRGDRDRNNRGGRDRNRGNRDNRSGRDSRAPRGFAPRTSLYGVDNTSTYNESPESAAEPVVLPGESLSKYRKDSGAPIAAAPKPVEAGIIIPSAPEFTIPGGWDGGDTLPGESLSRHRRSEGHPDRRSPYRQDIRTDHHTDPEPTNQLIQERNVADAAGIIEEQQPEVRAASSPELISQEPSTTLPAPVEYEPLDASASYRVDPVAPSEFRQSAPVLDSLEETLEAEAPETETPQAAEAIEELQAYSSTHSITPSPNESVAHLSRDLTPEPIPAIPERFDWQTGPVPTPVIAAETTPHDLTTLHATGDITSEASATTFIPSAGALVEETLDEE